MAILNSWLMIKRMHYILSRQYLRRNNIWDLLEKKEIVYVLIYRVICPKLAIFKYLQIPIKNRRTGVVDIHTIQSV